MDKLTENIPVLVVVVPLIGGILTTLVGRGIKPWAFATWITGFVFALTLRLFALVEASPTGYISYELGNWPAFWGIEYRVDQLNAFVLLVVAGIAFLTTIYACRSVQREIPADRSNFFYAVWLLAITGLLGITMTGDAFNVYVLLEISSLTIYALIAMGKDRDRRALTASLRYLILGSVGASFILLGIGYLLMVTGTLNMSDMHDQLAKLPNAVRHRTVLVAFAFLLVGLSLKMALFPLHMWLPKAYTFAPSAVSALLAATATKVGVYMAFRFLFSIFGVHFSFVAMPSHTILLACASVGVVVSSLNAIRQDNVKRMLAYSSIAQIGYIVMGFSLANRDGIAASLIHIFNHALMKGGMFMAIGAVAYRFGNTDLATLRGLGRRMPWTAGALALGGLSLVGFPLTAGFISKWYLATAAIDAGIWPLFLVILVGSLLALVYIWRLIEALYVQKPPKDAESKCEAPLSLVIPAWILVAGSIYFGIAASFTTNAAFQAADVVLQGGL